MIFIYIIYILFQYTVSAYSLDDEALYNKVRKTYEEYFPKTLIADIQSVLFDKIIKKIPKAYHCDLNKQIKVKYLFLKSGVEIIHVENVKNPFINRFQGYLDLYRSSKEFLEVFDNYQEFTKIYKWNYLSTDDKYHRVKMQRRAKMHYYFLFFFDTQNFFLKKIKYYDDFEILGQVDLDYIKEEAFFFLEKISIKRKEKNNWDNVFIILKNFKMQFKLNPKKVLSLQENCTSIDDLIEN